MPMNDFLNSTKFIDSSLDLSEEPFDFPVGLGMFYTSDNVLDIVLIKEIPE
jgi:hypothetical protein